MGKRLISKNPVRVTRIIQETISMAQSTKKKKQNEEIVKSIHLFSYEAFEVAKAFVGGDTTEVLKQKASELMNQLPTIADSAQEANPAYQADLNNALSEADLDLEYVLAGGEVPSSIRLQHFILENNSGKQDQ
jgi:hypothetical protein